MKKLTVSTHKFAAKLRDEALKLECQALEMRICADGLDDAATCWTGIADGSLPVGHSERQYVPA